MLATVDRANRAGQGLSKRRLISRTSNQEDGLEVSHRVKIHVSAEQLLAGSAMRQLKRKAAPPGGKTA